MSNDLTGERFGNLLVLGLYAKAPTEQDGHSYYRCRCSCGNIKIIRDTSLLSERTKSCGCLRYRTKQKGRPYVRSNN